MLRKCSSVAHLYLYFSPRGMVLNHSSVAGKDGTIGPVVAPYGIAADVVPHPQYQQRIVVGLLKCTELISVKGYVIQPDVVGFLPVISIHLKGDIDFFLIPLGLRRVVGIYRVVIVGDA